MKVGGTYGRDRVRSTPFSKKIFLVTNFAVFQGHYSYPHGKLRSSCVNEPHQRTFRSEIVHSKTSTGHIQGMFIARCGNKINVVRLSYYALSDGNFSTEIFRLSIPKLLFYIVIVSENTYVLEAGDECVFANH